MNSAKYWNQRASLLMYNRMEAAEVISQEIGEVYNHACKQIKHAIKGIFDTYIRKYKLTNKDAMRLLNTMKDPADIKGLKNALRKLGTEEALGVLSEISAPAYAARLKRFQELQEQIIAINKEVYNQDLTKQKGFYTSLCNDTYNRTIYDIQRQTGFGFSFKHISDKLIQDVMNSDWTGTGYTYSDTLWHNVTGVTNEVRKQLTWGLISGKQEREIAAEIANKYAVGAFESRRLVRTEACYLSNEIQFKAYKEAGAERYQYVATLDSRTDDECGALDRKVFYIKDKEPGVNCPPIHVFCRCTTKIYIDQNERNDLKRRARDPKTGKTYTVPASMSYSEWKKLNNL